MEHPQHNPADDPRPGFFRTRLVRGGPWLGARIFPTPCHCTIHGGDNNLPHEWRDTCDRYPRTKLSAEIDGQEVTVFRVWSASEEIEEAEYKYLIQVSDWDKHNDPDSPYVTPAKPIDLNQAKPIGP